MSDLEAPSSGLASRYSDIYSETELEWNAKARTFARQHLDHQRAEIDRGDRCRPLMYELGAAGLLGITLAPEYGGVGLDHRHNAVITEEIAAVSPSLGAMRGVSDVFVTSPLQRYASEAQKKEWLPGTVNGSRCYSLGITEPGAGSDASAISTLAVDDGDHFIVNGVKHFISGSAENDAVLMYVATDPDAAAARRLSAFLIPLDLPGIKVIPTESTGLRGLSHSRVELTDVVVPRDRLVGEVGQGMEIMLYGLGPERIDIAARALGCATRAYEEALSFAQTRIQFGKSIRKFQGVSHELAKMRVSLDGIRLLVRRAATLEDAGADSGQATAIAKLAATEQGFEICDQAMQIMGARGYAAGSAVDIMWRDIRALRFGGGTDQIMRHVIQRDEFRRYSA